MEITSILIGLLLLAASLFFIGMPFQKKGPGKATNSKTNVQRDGRETVVSALRDLDFDFRTGKVSEEDYTPLRARLMAEAARYVQREQEEDEKLEAMVQTRRITHQQGVKCDECGAPVEADQRFCSKCGSSINPEACTQCGKKIRKGDQFCPSCGKSVEVSMEAVAQS